MIFSAGALSVPAVLHTSSPRDCAPSTMHQLVAVGSRSQERADAFADTYDVPNRHASYEALAEDPEVDAVYVATPHPFHKENSILCLKAGKPVLCEKPFTINQHEAREVIEVARQRRRVFDGSHVDPIFAHHPTGKDVGHRRRNWRSADVIRRFWISRPYQPQGALIRSRTRRRRTARYRHLPHLLCIH